MDQVRIKIVIIGGLSVIKEDENVLIILNFTGTEPHYGVEQTEAGVLQPDHPQPGDAGAGPEPQPCQSPHQP